MSDEPIYCQLCGRKDCDHDPEHPLVAAGPYCHACGVIPVPDGECMFFKPGGNKTGCVPAPPSWPSGGAT